ncbi:hypothetical protein Ahy_B01g057104 isoform E [Arachis hypogaea]|uniref:Uncharacterized protein n=1 Tax=Arachis hypogaea TaxID=3818 RepID=A0A445B0E8_ARAHY|nr:hypothetical protein Ahy_B01g057104 isoform E [Arachis hypogaea]
MSLWSAHLSRGGGLRPTLSICHSESVLSRSRTWHTSSGCPWMARLFPGP